MSLITLKRLLRACSAAGSARLCAKLSPLVVVVASAMAVLSASETLAARVCKPKLTVASTTLSDMQPPFRERRWTAIIAADASQCATTAGYFELGILREKENAFDLEFREQFIWSGAHTLIGLDFWADEVVGTYWIDSVQACPCLSEEIAKSDPIRK